MFVTLPYEIKTRKWIQSDCTFCLSLFRLFQPNTTDLVVYKQQKLISHHSRGWKSKIKSTADSVPEESLLSGSLTADLALSSQDRRKKGALWELFYNPTPEGSTFMSSSQRPSHPNIITLGVRISTHGSAGGHKHSVHCPFVIQQDVIKSICSRGSQAHRSTKDSSPSVHWA